jgi:Zn finger protein HypA/HybF involved in hydrogenase expression
MARWINQNNILSYMNLLKQERAWCPVCLHEMSVNNLPTYEKLIWKINHYNACGIHLVELEHICPKCKRTQLIFTNGAKMAAVNIVKVGLVYQRMRV